MIFFKNRFLSLILILITLISCKESKNSSIEIDANYKCVNGLAKDTYPCKNFDLYAQMSPQELGGINLNDIWGWTDPVTNKEYALVGLTDGVTFVDISDPNHPIVVGKLLEHTSATKIFDTSLNEDFAACVVGIGETERSKNLTAGTTWRDLKIFDNHIFVVRDGRADGNTTHGMQVFDLTNLRKFSGTFLEFSEDAHYDRLNNAHNITINEETGFAYASGVTSSEICGTSSETGLHIIDVNTPLQPTYAGCFFDPATEIEGSLSVGVGYIHDTQCVTYSGPDSRYTNKEVCFSSAEGSVVISDVTDKSNPTTIGFSTASKMQYSHQGWLTEDHAYFLMNDELDERNLQRNTKTYIWDIKDLESPKFLGHYTHSTLSIDHNLYVKNSFVYQSNYTSGLRVFKIGDLDQLELSPVAYFDTQPSNDEPTFDGVWSNYPFFESGVIVVSDIEDGLFILRPNF